MLDPTVAGEPLEGWSGAGWGREEMRWRDRGQHLLGPLRSLLEFGESRNEQGLYLEPLTGSVSTQDTLHLVRISCHLTQRYQGLHSHTIQGCLVLSSLALSVMVVGQASALCLLAPVAMFVVLSRKLKSTNQTD